MSGLARTRARAEARRRRPEAAIERLDVSAFEIPTDGPDGRESDGTLEWSATTVVVVEAHGGGERGLGWTYADVAAALLVESTLAGAVVGADALAPGAAWEAMTVRIRNTGRPGIGFMAVSAVDVALWDLKARLLGLPLLDVLDARRDGVPVYGSGGFCNYPPGRLARQLAGFVEQGIPRVKLKVARRPEEDPGRLDAARAAVGEETELYVDANGAFTPKRALAWAERYAAAWGVRWLEEPVSSADLEGLRLVRERGPAGLEVAAGEYAFVPADARNLLAGGCVDCLQADVTRCGGITGLRLLDGLSASFGVDLSAHCAPQISAHAFAATARPRHLEYFHDHVRIERLLLDGALEPVGGRLVPDRGRPGLGLEPRFADVERFRVHGRQR